MYCLIVLPFLLQYLTNAEDLITNLLYTGKFISYDKTLDFMQMHIQFPSMQASYFSASIYMKFYPNKSYH
jgi:hypothetical protein